MTSGNPGTTAERIHIGQYNTLEVVREEAAGLYLRARHRGPKSEQLLLPGRCVPGDARIGSRLRVFVYTDSEDRPIATTVEPNAVVGDFAFLEVIDLSPHGAFLDWGLDKDLFAPANEQHHRLRVGDRYVFAVSLDERTRRVKASSQLGPYLDYEVQATAEGAEVDLLVYGHNDLGAQVIVDGRHPGLVYFDEAFRQLLVGDRLTGYVQRVRSDNKLDIRLQRTGRAARHDAQQLILDALEDADGFLPLHDKSPPAEIRAKLGLSKKAFKRALGGLYKARRIAVRPDGIERIAKDG